MTFFVVLLAILLAGGLIAWWGDLFATRRLERSVVVDRLPRKYIAWLPAQHRRKLPLPVVLAFHAAFGTAEGFEEHTSLHLAKEAEHFIIVYPDGYKRTWNAGDCCGPAMRENINDRKFFLAILDDLESVADIDRRRIYGTGLSNGARFCYYLAGTMSNVIAAIAPMGGAVLTAYSPARPVPIFHVHGLEDKWAPYYGGESAWKHVPVHEPVEDGIEFWRSVAGALVESRGSLFGGRDDSSTYSDAAEGTKIVLCRIPGLGHHWPGTRLNDKYRQFLERFDLGPLGPPININDAVLRFFSAFALPELPAKRLRLPGRDALTAPEFGKP
jgi:polyhydroxybutyrate depolymerase